MKTELKSAARRNFLKLTGSGAFTAAMVAGASGMLWSSEAVCVCVLCVCVPCVLCVCVLCVCVCV